jgi:hypothetical protein
LRLVDRLDALGGKTLFYEAAFYGSESIIRGACRSCPDWKKSEKDENREQKFHTPAFFPYKSSLQAVFLSAGILLKVYLHGRFLLVIFSVDHYT